MGRLLQIIMKMKKRLQWPCYANALRLLVIAAPMLGVSTPAAGMSKLSEYTKVIFDCPGIKLFGLGLTHSAIQTASMEPMNICLYNVKTHRGLKLKIPAAYISVVVKDEYGRPGAIGLKFWMPRFQPASAIPELWQPDPKKRLQYLKDNRKNLVQINLTYESNLPGYSDAFLQQYRESYRWTELPELGLEHYYDSCERLSLLKSQGRDISTRKCRSSGDEIFAGRSDVTKGMTLIQCDKNNNICSVSSRFEGHALTFSILPTEFSRLKECETAIDQFLHKYLIEKLPSGNNL